MDQLNNFFFEVEFAKDLWRWYDILNTIKDHKALTNDPILDKIQAQIIVDRDAALAYFYALHFNYKTYLMQRVIVESKNPKYLFGWAKDIVGADKKAIQSLIMATHNVKYICYFGLFVKGANTHKIEQIVAKSKQAKYAHLWVKHHKGAKISLFKQIIIDSKKPKYLLELARHLTRKQDIKTIENALVKLGSLTYIRLFASEIRYADIPRLEAIILKSHNMVEIKKFAKSVKGSSIGNFYILF